MKLTFQTLLFLLLLHSCGNSHNIDQLEKIDMTTIEVVEIKKYLYDTVSVQLSDEQTKQFVEYVNTTKGTELIKSIPKYWIFIKFKSDSVKLYKIHHDLIGDGDTYIKITDSTYFKNIYESNIKAPHLISIK